MKKRSLLRVVRAAREPKVTQSTVARMAGLSASRYWQIENGEGSLASDAERKAIADALGAKVSDIDWPELEKSAAS